MMCENKSYYPLSGRLKIPATTTPGAPYTLVMEAQARNLEWIEIHLPQAGVLQDLGVRISTNERQIYPAMGSNTDSNFAGGKDSYGAMPTSGLPLHLPFNQRLFGTPYRIKFEFYNDGAGTVAVNIFVVVSEEKPMSITPSKKAEAEKNVS
jgi:hypothetical protein